VFDIRPAEPHYRNWIAQFLTDHWGSPRVVSRGQIHSAELLPGFIVVMNGQRVGLITHRVVTHDRTVRIKGHAPKRRGAESDRGEARALLGARAARYLMRFQPTSVVPPIEAATLHLMSSPVKEMIGRFWSVPVQAGHVPPSTFKVMTLSATV
jgi:hypothetical protein